jgi:predicted permease
MPEASRERWGRALFAALVRLLPSDLRRRSGEEMRATFDARQLDAVRRGRRHLLVLWAREAVGLLSVAVRARIPSPSSPPDSSRGAPIMETLSQDLRYVLRSLRRTPAFTGTALAVIAVGVGATVAIFSAVNAVLLRPLPFHEPDRLVMLWEHSPEKDWWQVNAAPANALDWRERVDAFEDVALYDSFSDGLTFVGGSGAEQLVYTQVSGNFFDVLGVSPALGEGFTWEDTWEGADRPGVLSWETWTTRFGADPGVVGGTVDFGGVEVRVAGVMPEGFSFPGPGTDLWLSYRWPSVNRAEAWFRRAHWVWPVARLRPEVTFQEAAAQLGNVAADLTQSYPETNADLGAGMTPLHEFLVGDRRAPLVALLSAVGLLLLIACSNVANLLLVRAQGRGRELAVRRAVGAGGGRLARLVLLESAVLATAGGALGFLAGVQGVRALDGLRSLTLPGVAGLEIDHRVVLFATGVVAACTLLFGLPSAWRARGAEPAGVLREGRPAGGGRRALRITHGFVVAEVALSLLLVLGAGLMARSFLRLRAEDPGVRVEQVMTFRIVAPANRYASRDETVGLFRTLDARLEALPDVESAAMARVLSPGTWGWSSDFSEATWAPERVGREILHREVSSDYFEVLNVPLRAGRTFNDADVAEGDWVVVVNEAFVREHFPGEDVVDRRITFDAVPTDASRWRTIVGVVGDERQEGLSVPPRPEVFAPLQQDWTRGVSVVLRTRGEPTAVMPAVRAALAEVDPLLPPVEIRSMEQVVAEALARDRFLLVLAGVFGAAALALAAVGVYGVMDQATRRRTPEVGIRMALGARASHVRRMLLRQGMGLVAAGLGLGLTAALAGGRVVGSLLYEVAPSDPVTFVAVPALLAIVGLAACWLPARRATSVDPARSLQAE